MDVNQTSDTIETHGGEGTVNTTAVAQGSSGGPLFVGLCASCAGLCGPISPIDSPRQQAALDALSFVRDALVRDPQLVVPAVDPLAVPGGTLGGSNPGGTPGGSDITPPAAPRPLFAGFCPASLTRFCPPFGGFGTPNRSPQSPNADDDDRQLINVQAYESLQRVEENQEKLLGRRLQLEKNGDEEVRRFLDNSQSVFSLIVPNFIVYQLQQAPCRSIEAFSVIVGILLLVACCFCGRISYNRMQRLGEDSKAFNAEVDGVIFKIDELLEPQQDQPFTHGQLSIISLGKFRRRLYASRRTLHGLNMEKFRCHCMSEFISTFLIALLSFIVLPAITYFFICRNRQPELRLPSFLISVGCSLMSCSTGFPSRIRNKVAK